MGLVCVGSAIGTSLSCEDEALLRACYMLVAHGTLSKDVPTVGADAADEYKRATGMLLGCFGIPVGYIERPYIQFGLMGPRS